MGRAAVGGRGQHGHFGANLGQQRHDVGLRIVLGVQQHVEQRELDLAQRLHARLEVLGRDHLVVQCARQWLARVHVGGHVLEHFPLPAEVFHELARQFHRVPFHARDARDIALVDLGQHVVQAMACLMEQRDHVIVREQGRLAVNAGGKVADQVRDRRLQLVAVGAQPAGAYIVHPGAAALARTCGLVQVELADQLGPCGVLRSMR